MASRGSLRKSLKLLPPDKLKCNKFDLGWGLRTALPNPLRRLKGPTSKEREEKEGKGYGKGEENGGEWDFPPTILA